MRIKNTVIFLLIIAIIGFAVFTALNGIKVGGLSIEPVRNYIRQGLDLKGGVSVVYEAKTDAAGNELDQKMQQVIEVFRRRVDAMGLTEPVIAREGDKRIRVELPGIKDAQEAIKTIGKTAQLLFISPDEEIILTGNNVRNAQATYDTGKPTPGVSLEFDEEGRTKFAEATGKFIGQPIYIVLDDEVISAPVVEDQIHVGNAVITGNFTIEEASNLAALIRAGALPVALEEVQTRTVTASLGEEAFNRSIKAAIIGILLVLLFMLFFYKIPGLVADIALFVYILVVLGILAGLNATLTLPSIAALILSVGMAVDANIIIFARIKEEIRTGKSIRASVDAGFKRALGAILDSNITTLIAGFVLYYFGTGPIRGFAVMLIIGIAASMFTALVVTKFLLKLIVGMDITKNQKLFGA